MNIAREIVCLKQGEIPEFEERIGDINKMTRIFEEMMSELYSARINFQNVGYQFFNWIISSIYSLETMSYEFDKFKNLIDNNWSYITVDSKFEDFHKYMSILDDMLGAYSESISSIKDSLEGITTIQEYSEKHKTASEKIGKIAEDENESIKKAGITDATVKEANSKSMKPQTPAQMTVKDSDSNLVKSIGNLTNIVSKDSVVKTAVQKISSLKTGRSGDGGYAVPAIADALGEINGAQNQILTYDDVEIFNMDLNELLSMRRMSSSRVIGTVSLIIGGVSLVSKLILKLTENANRNHQESEAENEAEFNSRKANAIDSINVIKASIDSVLDQTYIWIESFEEDIAWWTSIKEKMEFTHLTRITLHIFRLGAIDKNSKIFKIYSSQNYRNIMFNTARYYDVSSMKTNLRFNITLHLPEFSYALGQSENIDNCTMFKICRCFFEILNSTMRILAVSSDMSFKFNDVSVDVDDMISRRIMGKCKINSLNITFTDFYDSVTSGLVIGGQDILETFYKSYNFMRQNSYS